MQIHRLLWRPHAESLLRGSFRFGRLRYYQMLEVVFEDASIGDAQEGTTSALVSTKITPENQDDPVRLNLSRSGFITASGNASIEIRNAKFAHETDCFVCCWSTSSTPDLSGAGAAYDTCVTATGAKSLAHYLESFGVERDSGYSLRDLFQPILAGRVQYLDLDHDMAAGPLPSGDPFRKRTRYRSQFEYRLVLVPRKTISADFLWVDCPQAAEFLQSTPVEQIVAQAQFTKELEDSEQILNGLLEEWRRVQNELSTIEEREFNVGRIVPGDAFHAAAWHATQEALHARRMAAWAEFDKAHLKQLRRCLFALRKAPFNDALDRALARGAASHRLIQAYERGLVVAPR